MEEIWKIQCRLQCCSALKHNFCFLFEILCPVHYRGKKKKRNLHEKVDTNKLALAEVLPHSLKFFWAQSGTFLFVSRDCYERLHLFDDAHCCQGNTTFPRVLFMLIVLFLPLSSSCFWPETQSTKCECPPGFEFTLVVSLRPSSVLLLLFVSVSLPLRHSYWNHLSPPVPLLSHVPCGHETAVWPKQKKNHRGLLRSYSLWNPRGKREPRLKSLAEPKGKIT